MPRYRVQIVEEHTHFYQIEATSSQAALHTVKARLKVNNFQGIVAASTTHKNYKVWQINVNEEVLIEESTS